ncbi:hypothetical protein [Candidatus Enterococcus ferrettii]|uniref:Fibronectin type-III domain-containing protein n=1 Tax=Candidatus Enterococcus ferrettii TaxID=2815324 RepID=A0ABV0ERH0_9ENTE|nr:hypothetical protein [Enterococcus sp. 665A]MBO1341923.1 hypothetical protein [Enterococcus sp. 665A]
MKPATKKLINYLLVSGLLLQSLSPILAVATMVEESSTQETVSESTSENLKESVSSDSETVESTIESTTENEIEKVTVIPTEVEKEYDERNVEEKSEAVSSHPVIQLEDKNLEERLVFKGKISADSVTEEETTSSTILKKVVLQSKTVKKEWKQADEIKLEEEKKYLLNEEAVSFDFSVAELTEDTEYRLILDYEVQQEVNGEVQAINQHKAQYLIGTAEAKKVVLGPLQEKAAFGLPRVMPDRLWYKEIFNPETLYTNYYKVRVLQIESRRAKIDYMFHIGSANVGIRNATVLASEDPQALNRIRARATNKGDSRYIVNEEYNLIAMDSSIIKVNYRERDDGDYNIVYEDDEVWLNNLKPNRKYYFWLCRQSGAVGNPIYLFKENHHDLFTGMGADNIWNPFDFRTDFTPMTFVGVPGFTQTSATPTSIPMTGSNYVGDILEKANNGLLQVTSNNGTTAQTKVSNLSHDITTNGRYGGATINGLEAGTRYKGRTVLVDVEGNNKYSNWSNYFYTPNTVNQPGISALGIPSLGNNATADVTATYNAGNEPAHPTQVEVSISTNNSNWSVINTGTTPATTNPSINSGNKQVAFKLSKLNANTKYFVRYRVKNASNIWSSPSASREFTTKGIPVTVQPPKVTNVKSDRATVGDNTYTGTVTANQGLIQYTNQSGAGMVSHDVTNLSYSNGRYGTVNLTNLYGGSKYRTRTRIKDSNNGDVWSGWTNFVTPTELTALEVTGIENPTAAANGVASIKGFYKAATGTREQAAHPNRIQVQIQEVGTSAWATATVTDQNFVVANKRITFKIRGLKAGAKYNVQYRAENGTNNGSASEVWSDWKSTNNLVTVPSIPLIINPPKMTNVKATTAVAGNNSYTGNVSTARGRIEYTPETGDGMQISKVENLTHSGTIGGTYGQLALPALREGAKYRARTVLKTPSGTDAYSSWTNFVTPTELSEVEVTGVENPTAAANGVASIKGFYKTATGTREQPANPTRIQVQIQEVGTSAWATATVTDQNFVVANKRITFKIRGLKAGSKYNVQYRAENGTNNGSTTEVWSEWKKTNNIISIPTLALVVYKPIVTNVKATSATVGNGYYTGNISSAKGKILYSAEVGSGMQVAEKLNLPHPGTVGGNYGTLELTNLKPGANYRAKAYLLDPLNNIRQSDWQPFVTPTTLNRLRVESSPKPTSATNGEATFSGVYTAATDARENPAHPNRLHVQIRVNGTTGWQEVSPQNIIFSKPDKKVTFTLRGLSSKTKYDVQYRLENGTNNGPGVETWSGWYVCNNLLGIPGIQLRINPPTIPQADNTTVGSNFVQLHTTKYYGDISQIFANGQFSMMKASETNWLAATTVYNDLIHERHTGVEGASSNISYNGPRTISALTPGTKFKGRLTVPDYEEVLVHSPEKIFCTALTVNSPTASATERPITVNTAKATVSGSYNADAMSPAHANAAEVQISLTGNPNDFSTLVYNSTGTNPSLNSAPTINPSTKSVEFKLKNLKENTTYHVRYRLKNESNKWSDWSTANTVTTLTRMPGYYFENVPEFNFGSLTRSDVDTTNPLASTSGSFNMEIENVGMVNNWVLSAKLSPITTFDGSNLELTNAALIVGKKLSRSSDGGSTWSDVSGSFNVGSVGNEVLPSNTSVELWKSPNSASVQGKFKYTIDRNSVQLKVLGGTAQATREYRGKVTWTMDTLP